jgi:hypothetical protein
VTAAARCGIIAPVSPGPAMRALLLLLIPLLVAAAPDRGFDRRLALKRVDLGPSETEPSRHAELRCHYYAHLMAKEVDLREVGDSELSLLPYGGARPDCQRAALPGEQVIADDAWHGYFDGLAHGFAIFSAEDGVNGALGFALFRPGGPKPAYASAAFGARRFSAGPDGTTQLRFIRMVEAKCSVPREGAACIAAIARATGVAPVTAGMCTAGYEANARMLCKEAPEGAAACLARRRAQDSAAPTVVGIPTLVTLGPGGTREEAVGAPMRCGPSD